MKGVKDYRCGRWPMTEQGCRRAAGCAPTLGLSALQSRVVPGASHRDLEGFALVFLSEPGDQMVATFPQHSAPVASSPTSGNARLPPLQGTPRELPGLCPSSIFALMIPVVVFEPKAPRKLNYLFI